ncbi:intermembrane phospholipid transport protein YdbH family protein [Hirschia litorea]|uniref:YdbH domain-containing protein n=1 Tax=Hirschia litorea TaxID=1199156 RepID=A0ABW2IMQ9_9PROT
MTELDQEQLSDMPDPKKSIARKNGFVWAGFLILAVVLCAIYVARLAITDRFIAGKCLDLEIPCNIKVSHIGIDRVDVTHLEVSISNTEKISGRDIEIQLDWLGLFKPNVSKVTFKEAIANVDVSQGSENIEKFIRRLQDIAETNGQREAQSSPMHVEIESIGLKLATKGGDVDVKASMQGELSDGQGQVVFPFEILPVVYKTSDFRSEVKVLSGKAFLNGDRIESTVEFQAEDTHIGATKLGDVSGTLPFELDLSTGQMSGILDLAVADLLYENKAAEELRAQIDLRGKWNVADRLLSDFSAQGDAKFYKIIGFENAFAQIKHYASLFPANGLLGKWSPSEGGVDMVLPFAFNLSDEGMVLSSVPKAVTVQKVDDFEIKLGSALSQWAYDFEARKFNFTGDMIFQSDLARLEMSDLDLVFHDSELNVLGAAKLNASKDAESLKVSVEGMKLISTSRAVEAELLNTQIDFSGRAFNADWKGVSIGGDLKLGFDEGDFAFHQDPVLDISIESISTQSAKIGSFRTQYKSRNFASANGGFSGQGMVAGLNVDLQRAGQIFDIEIDGADLDWSIDDTLNANMVIAAPKLSSTFQDKPVQANAPEMAISLYTDSRWRVEGYLDEGQLNYQAFAVNEIASKFHISGSEAGLIGGMKSLSFGVTDTAENIRFVPMRWKGGLELAAGHLRAIGELMTEQEAHALGSVEVRHDFVENAGAVKLFPTNLTFSPERMQPYSIFPTLRGVASNVRGNVTLQGGINWVRGKLSSSGIIDLTDLGFVTDKAGLFEGVFGRIEFDDILKQHSLPHQEILIDQWNAGAPMENGKVQFQVLEFGEVFVHGSQWPFATGTLSLEPMIWSVFSGTNAVEVEVQNVDLAGFVNEVKLPGVEASGKLDGRVSAVFSTGRVAIERAHLASSSGGIIRYYTPAMEELATTGDRVALLVNALKDFQYDEMAVDVRGDLSGEMMLDVYLAGQSPEVIEGRGIVMDVSIESELMSLLGSQRMVDGKINAFVQRLHEKKNGM